MARSRIISASVSSTTVFRWANYDSPLWSRENRTPARWHARGDGPTQYLAFHPDGAWAEFARRENLRTEEELTLIHVRLWAVTVEEGRLADYSTFEKADDAGLQPEALIDDDHQRCQAEGRRLRSAGYTGVLTPSAALPGTVNLTLFGLKVMSAWGIAPRLSSAMPACVVAVGGPAPGLATRVRHIGEPHSGFEAFIDRQSEEERKARLDDVPPEPSPPGTQDSDESE